MNLAGPATRRPPPLAGQSRARPAGAWTWMAAAASLVLALTAVSSRYLWGAAAGTAFCTPYGFRIAGYYRSLVGNPQLMHNALEWSPPSLRDPVSWGFFAVAARAG